MIYLQERELKYNQKRLSNMFEIKFKTASNNFVFFAIKFILVCIAEF